MIPFLSVTARRHLVVVLLGLLNWASGPRLIADSPDVVEVDFSRQIRPLLAKQCFSCHGPDKQESGVALHDFAKATGQADSGHKAIVPGNIEKSEILRRITSEDPSQRMPPEGPGLSKPQSELIRKWIQSGAEYREHWAFLPLSDPKSPPTQPQFVASNPIDAFVQERWLRNDLKPSANADPRKLIRRLYFDCIGVPPDLKTVERFASNPSESAYGELVDELLADPRFGERMARDWLDLVRYAETNSFERDGPKPNAWKYRDYVIDSFNEDKPYDRFLLEQLAGDELDTPDKASLTATGFYRVGIWDDEPADPLQAKFDGYDDLVSTIGQGVMGLTLNCARCHDHKIDPIPQKDYYQMVAFLRDVTPYGSRSDEKTNSQINVTGGDLARQNSELKNQLKEIRESIRRIEEIGIAKMTDEDKKAAKSPDRDKVLREHLKSKIESSEWGEYESLKKNAEETRKQLDSLPLDFRLGLAKCDPSPEETFVLLRGSPQAQGDKVEPAFPKIFQEAGPVMATPKAGSTGRRTVLAKWLASPTNRLTGRVIANRIWQHHFGRGIVRSANNFGQLGDPPTHPELLDFLAQQLVRFDWHLKPLHRMMLMSSTYRLDSSADAESNKRDPSNDSFSRFNVRRLSAEEIRDAVLTVNGRINWEQHGPSIYPNVSSDVKAGQSRPGEGWGKSSLSDQSRRSVYIYIKRSLVPPELSVFDFPETDTSCEARFLTTQAAQAMNMLNGAFMQEQASHFAEHATNPSQSSLTDWLKVAIEAAYSRAATGEEIQRGANRILALRDKFGLSEQQAFREYCLVLLNSNEFIYLD
ncbi:MAG: DUF1549 domain-containing protein [Planctomycetota bacterium]|nr:DUF1549 domain-containing protein [Planctomycetota bacterium]